MLEERCRQGAGGTALNVRLSVEGNRREQTEVEKTWGEGEKNNKGKIVIN